MSSGCPHFQVELNPSKRTTGCPFQVAISRALLRDTGLEFDTDLPLPLLTEWRVMLTLMDHTKWAAQGVVVACDPILSGGWHVAVYFIHKEEVNEDVMAFSA